MNSPTNISRLTHQLQIKKTEVDQLMAEANKLSEENDKLTTINKDLIERLNKMQSMYNEKASELESFKDELKHQQQRIQNCIEKETQFINERSQNNVKWCEKFKQLESAYMEEKQQYIKQIDTLEKNKVELEETVTMYKKSMEIIKFEESSLEKELTKKVEDLEKYKLKSYQIEEDLKVRVEELEAQLKRKTSEFTLKEMKSKDLANLNQKTKEAVKLEVDVLIAEIQNLNTAIEYEKEINAQLRTEHKTITEQLKSSRMLMEERVSIASQEIKELSAQHESILVDFEKIYKENEELSKNEASLLDRIKCLTEALERTQSVLSNQVDTKEHEENLFYWKDKVTSLEKQLKSLADKTTEQNSSNTYNDSIYKENAECKANVIDNDCKTNKEGIITLYNLKEISDITHHILYKITSLYYQVSHQAPELSDRDSEESIAMSLPMTKCTRYEHQELNVIHRELGGIRFMLKQIEKEVLSAKHTTYCNTVQIKSNSIENKSHPSLKDILQNLSPYKEFNRNNTSEINEMNFPSFKYESSASSKNNYRDIYRGIPGINSHWSIK